MPIATDPNWSEATARCSCYVFRALLAPGSYEEGDYPGFVVTLPNDIDGDFHNGFLDADHDPLNGRLFGAVDIAHEKNHRFVRSPVPGLANNIPAGRTPAFGRLADQPDPANRRFDPDRDLPPILLFDPKTGQGGIQVFPFNTQNPHAGDPVEEEAGKRGPLPRSAGVPPPHRRRARDLRQF